jgi:uncharacterized phiE125 gp8 family phage protein
VRGVIDTTDTLITAPAMEPLDLDETKRALKIDSSNTDEDTLVDVWIAAAREYFEEQTGRQVMASTREYALDAFPADRQIEIPRPMLLGVTSIVYDDASGTEQTVDASTYDVLAPAGSHSARGRVKLKSGLSWPTIGACEPKSVRIRYVAGYGYALGDVPSLVVGALYFLVGHFYAYREEVQKLGGGQTLAQLPMGASFIMQGFKYSALPTLLPQYCSNGSRWVA